MANHVRGMILLKQNRVDEAISHFSQGLATVEFARHTAVFESALAIAYLRKSQFLQAASVLSQETAIIANVLLLHAYAGAGQRPQAARALEKIERSSATQVIELGREIARRFKLNTDRPSYDENWIFEREYEAVLLEAA